MPLLTGTLLVLGTWSIGLVVLVALGLPLSLLGGPVSRRHAVRTALWWGLSAFVIIVLALNLAQPLGRPTSLVVVAVVALGAGVTGLVLLRRARLPAPSNRARAARWLPVAVALAAAIVYLAAAALGPVTNYDTGLYHLGAIRYQQEFGLAPGIANLHFPLGYANSVVPMAAFLTSTPWAGEGYRLLNGLLLVLLAVDTVLRVRQGRWSPGTWLLVIAQVFVWIPLVALADYWVTSPTSDSSVLILTAVAVAYLADALVRRRGWVADAGVAAVTSVVLVTMRPTAAVFALGVWCAIAARVLLRRREAARGTSRIVTLVVAVALIAAVLQVMRDRVLSGWVQYPLSVMPLEVPWRAPDPVWVRLATLGAARDPQDLWHAAESWGWIPGWLSRAAGQWETALLVCLLVLSVVVLVMVRRRRITLAMRAWALAMVPSAMASLAWFFASPPYFRFGWGPLFTLVALPAAFGAAALAAGSPGRLLAAARALMSVAVIVVVGVSAGWRMPWAEITSTREWRAGPIGAGYVVAPLPETRTKAAALASGQTVQMPIDSDQCWGVYPLCSPMFDEGVTMPGPTIAEGFRP